MNETFIASAFAAMGEKVVNVKIMKNKSTGYASLILLLNDSDLFLSFFNVLFFSIESFLL